jgi:predicted nucleic acid-binding protein
MFDSSAWIEYFAGSALGLHVKHHIDGSESIFTPSIALLEIKNKYLREKRRWEKRIDFICQRSTIVNLDDQIALLGADMKQKYGLFAIDAIVYASSSITKTKLLTKDHHFQGLKDVILLEEDD